MGNDSSIPEAKKLIAEAILNNRETILKWFQNQSEKTPTPFYSSVDLRDADFKLGAIDSNLYPAGFNNICNQDRMTAPPIFKKLIEFRMKKTGAAVPQKILILPEAHTQNKYYAENLYFLNEIIQNAGFQTQIGWYSAKETAQDNIELTSVSGKKMTATPIEVENQILRAGDFEPNAIILNNDFSGNYPAVLDGIKQPIFPSHKMGWHTRKKSQHFTFYNQLAEEFSKLAGIDPWLIRVETELLQNVELDEENSRNALAEKVQLVLDRTRKNYERYSIQRTPYAVVKSNSGTYGMGIMTVKSGEEVRELNRRQKNKMSVGKGQQAVTSLIIQEGIPSATVVNRLPAEPVIYLLGCDLIGGFLRTNTEKSDEENLNARGMVFKKLCMSDLREVIELEDQKEVPLLELVYGSMAQLSALAAGMEIAEQ